MNLTRSGISKFPNIKKNQQLTKLTLTENNITLKRFKGNSTLEYLNLRRNKVTVVPNKISRKFTSLTDLSFNMNPVKKVKPGLGKLTKLEYLSFYANGISEIPKSVYNLTSLKTIDLFDNRIEFVSPEIKKLQNLEVLYLANNRLYSLPEEIGSLKNLRELYIYNNRMDTLPASMDNLEKLEVLWVNDNFFHAIPAATWRAKNMTYLDASQNFIKKVPDEIVNAKLSTLILSGKLMQKEVERLQPIYVDDLAQLAVGQGARRENGIINAIGPETFTYKEMVKMIGEIIGQKRPIMPLPPALGYAAGWVVSRFVDDVLITREEIAGLVAGLLCVDTPPTGHTRLTEWARRHMGSLGKQYTSELGRRRESGSGLSLIFRHRA